MKRENNAQPDQALRETEEAAYHAFREWPVLLVLRKKELAALGSTPTRTDKPAVTNEAAK